MMHSRAKIKEAKEAAERFLKAVAALEKEYPAKKPSECVGEPAHFGDWHGFGNKHSGEVKAASIILTRRLADMRRFR